MEMQNVFKSHYNILRKNIRHFFPKTTMLLDKNTCAFLKKRKTFHRLKYIFFSHLLCNYGNIKENTLKMLCITVYNIEILQNCTYNEKKGEPLKRSFPHISTTVTSF